MTLTLSSPLPCSKHRLNEPLPGQEIGASMSDFPKPGAEPRAAAQAWRPTLPELGEMGDFSGPPPRSGRVSSRPMPTPQEGLPEADYTDADLRAALVPLVADAMAGELSPHDATLEAMMRSTFRRALAEHRVGPFQAPGATHRVLWRMQALFTSRSYDEVLQEKVRRFHVDEVHLLDHKTLSMISYASSDPAVHAHPRKAGTISRSLALHVRTPAGEMRDGFSLEEGRRAVIREGRLALLVAVIHGDADELVKADLDYALKRIETRYRRELEEGVPLLRELQPLLEECLLIQSPAGPPAV